MYNSPYPKISPCVKGLIIANVAVFIAQVLPGIGDLVTAYGGMQPVYAFLHFELWRLVSYMFLHDPNSMFHIIFNMLVLWWFGPELEDIWGGRKFLIFYFICGVGAGLFSFFNLFINPDVLVIGASGAVLGLLTAYALYYPATPVLLFFVLPMKMRTLIIGYAAISVFMSFSGGAGGGGKVSHITHLGGIVVAFIYMKIFPSIELWFRKRVYVWRSKMRR
jgi:membrane associated rhomboid family serine protease